MQAHGFRTTTGNVRQHNEDCYLADAELGLWLVADGMGGHAGGEVASAIVRDTVRDRVASGDTLADAIRQAHRNILDAVERGEGAYGMGSTVVAARVDGIDYEICWVGDSRAYLWDGRLTQISKDHSLVQQMVDAGAISEEQAHEHPDKNLIYQCLGSSDYDIVEVDSVSGQFTAGQKLLLCSDGLNDDLRDTVIATILEQDGNDQALVDRLVEAALDARGGDNITVVLISAPEDAPQNISQTLPISMTAKKTKWRWWLAALLLLAVAVAVYGLQENAGLW